MVTHEPEQQRFTTVVDGLRGVVDYRRQDQVMNLVHTEVDPRLQGRGVAAALVKTALAHAEAEGLKVRPLCSYVGSYMRRHPETQHLLA